LLNENSICIIDTRPTLIFQWAGVSLTLAQRAQRLTSAVENKRELIALRKQGAE
jgi:hypothetical protein